MKCKYIAFLDSDAFPCNNEWLETAINFLDNNSKYSAVFGSWYNTKEDTFEQHCVRIQRFMPLFARKEYWKIIDATAKESASKEFISANVIIRYDDFISVGMMNENIYIDEDIELSGRFIKNGYGIYFNPKMSVFHRESKIYSYLRKVFCAGYYYSNMIIKGRYQNNLKKFEKYFLKDAFWHIYPLFLSITYMIIFYLFLKNNISIIPLLFFPLIALLIILFSSYKACFKLEKNRISGFFLISFISFLFCIIYVFSTFCGLFNIPTKNIYSMFKQ